MSLKVIHSSILPPELENQMMIVKIREGSIKFTNDFYRKYLPKKYQAIKNVDPNTADIIYCETMSEIIVMIKDESKREITNLDGYVYRCLSNAANKYHRNKNKSRIEFHSMDEDWKWSESTIDDEGKEEHLVIDMMEQVMGNLKELCKSVLEDKYLKGYTYKQIQAKYKKPTENAAKWYGNDCLKQAREAGRKLFRKNYTDD